MNNQDKLKLTDDQVLEAANNTLNCSNWTLALIIIFGSRYEQYDLSLDKFIEVSKWRNKYYILRLLPGVK